MILSEPACRPFWQPPDSTCVKLMATGATVGTVVDSLHNQVLLEYHVAPLQIPSLVNHDALWLASSWTVPPLLAVAYLVLGGILPRVVQKVIASSQSTSTSSTSSTSSTTSTTSTTGASSPSLSLPLHVLQRRALQAVTTTALIIKLSDLLVRHPTWALPLPVASDVETQHLILLFVVAAWQWWTLDGTVAALILAAITAYGGPLAELPFVQANIWTYLPSVAHYFPLQGDGPVAMLLRAVLHNQDDTSLAICTVSAPCYFAVSMDAIALGRWFDAQHDTDDQHENTKNRKSNQNLQTQ